MGGVFVCVFIFFLTLLTYIFLSRGRREPQRRATLPPGSMGWPYVGETLQLYTQDPSVFFAAKQKRYGEIFKTHILGCPCVMLASPEASRFVLVTEAQLFKPTYPKSKERLIGPSALFFHQGDYHTRLRKLVQGSLSLDTLRNLVKDIDAIAASTLDSWGGGHFVNTFHELKRFSFEVGILAIFGHLDARYSEELKKNYCLVDNGYNSFPTNIPGTPYKKALLARKRLTKILSVIICERKEKKLDDKDLLGCLLNSKDERGETLSEDQIADNIIGVLFAAQDTTASVMTWIVKYLHDNPKLLEVVKAEQKAVRKSNDEGNQPLSWSQTRNMPISYKVVLESLRMASIISFTFREAVADVEYKECHRVPNSKRLESDAFVQEHSPKPRVLL
ncbi:abscisic acid 8'-hydroxylase CYP707A1-like isoform X2 [Alnus glutinosa]|uniref:abscisic acid 8'-hydroxylase CYP707A1-like isoform X2 n=1 Tax=Alnus glutinosa TaxID=3517 RepID=UPI002D76530C|nr:abscisic acid 8'-hydroxylase CYP707A1-like isoform X2 [Alnus glutinosa]